ncbi:MAG TPA: DUF2339 domain-containing protein [Candidatus Eisenbacteria bacterium]|nr:DUF2339 domain-containing protein [Candidatus Eisenbacteria bacterium]
MDFLFLAGLILLVVVGVPVWVLVHLARISARLSRLERELAHLRQRSAEGLADEFRALRLGQHEAAPAPSAAPSTQPPAAMTLDEPPPPPPPPPLPLPVTSQFASPAASSPRIDFGRIEQLVGGVWLQNLGAVLLLVGLFLMIVWGYGTRRFGPQVLVIAGVALGLAFAWRGDRVARRMPRFGHGLIGTGIGVIYLTLYLGFVRLHVLGPEIAFPLLALVSFGSIMAGLHYRVQLIGALGVVGAFLPQFLAGWLGMGGFHLSSWILLGYLAVVDVLVFVLSARAGWSALALAALLLSAMSWSAAFFGVQWGWGQQIGLSILFTALGLAPLRRLVRVEGPVRGIDLAVVAAAPLALMIASSPFLMYGNREYVGMLLFALAAVWTAAALWVDVRKPERDLWIPLTAAATLYATAGIARVAGLEYTRLAWCAEGAVLLALGLRPRAGWLRVWGSLIMAAGGFWSLGYLIKSSPEWGMPPILHADGLLTLGEIAAVLTGSFILARGRSRLTSDEQFTPELWSGFGNLLLMFWISAEASAIASALVDPQSGLQHLPPALGISLDQRRTGLDWAIRGAGWMAQAVTLVLIGTRGERSLLRIGGHLIGILAMFVTLFRLWAGNDGWGRDWMPVLNPLSLLGLGVTVGAFMIAARLSGRRSHLAPVEVRAAEVWCAAAILALMSWTSRESEHLTTMVAAGAIPVATRRLQALMAACTSGAWLLEAVLLLVAGWWRASAFLRWSGLVVIGVTLLKFVVVDLQSVDLFWRFLTAIVVGAAMLGMSYVYQRQQGRAREAESET